MLPPLADGRIPLNRGYHLYPCLLYIFQHDSSSSSHGSVSNKGAYNYNVVLHIHDKRFLSQIMTTFFCREWNLFFFFLLTFLAAKVVQSYDYFQHHYVDGYARIEESASLLAPKTNGTDRTNCESFQFVVKPPFVRKSRNWNINLLSRRVAVGR